jgi:hypothetical protein
MVGGVLGWLLVLVGCLVSDAVCRECQEELGTAVPGWACQADLDIDRDISLTNELHWDWS